MIARVIGRRGRRFRRRLDLAAGADGGSDMFVLFVESDHQRAYVFAVLSAPPSITEIAKPGHHVSPFLRRAFGSGAGDKRTDDKLREPLFVVRMQQYGFRGCPELLE